jgi:DNA repair protein RecO (recombination protein O)
MAPLETSAVVLHAFDYLETSRILRLATRDAGVVSVLARGARRSRQRFGPALDLFVEGAAEIHIRPGRELQTLAAFEVTRARTGIALDIGRFTAANVLAELVLRFGHDEYEPLYDALVAALDAVSVAAPERAVEVGLAGAWHLVATLGFAPAVDVCASCHAEIDSSASALFSHPAGGVLCVSCGANAGPARTLQPHVREALGAWLEGQEAPSGLSDLEARAHQRLLREFLREHLSDDRPLRALDVWERGRWELPSSATNVQ